MLELLPLFIRIKTIRQKLLRRNQKFKKRFWKSQVLTNLVEIKIENSNIIIPENSKMEKISLALAIYNLTTPEKERNNKNYPPETEKWTRISAKKQKTTNLIEIKTNNNENIKISKSPKIDSFSLAIVNLTTKEKSIEYKTKDSTPKAEIPNKKVGKP